MKARIFKVEEDGKVVEAGLREVDKTKTTEAMMELRKVLESEGLTIRSIAPTSEGWIAVYLQDQEIKRPTRKKPVRHDGPVGRGRSVRRKGDRNVGKDRKADKKG